MTMSTATHNAVVKDVPTYGTVVKDGITTTDVVIIGCGIAGITTAIDMIRQGNGRNFIILEKNTQVGGTWNDNQYPGCCCDVWSHLYSLSFAPNTEWSREYSTQPEILNYLVGVAAKYNLFRHVRFNSSVVGSHFDDASGTWTTTVTTDGGKAAEFSSKYQIRSRFLVSAVGQLNAPSNPKIQGLDDFQGKVMHSSRWDRTVSLAGKRIGVIGNGASAIQIVPELAKVASSVVVFQRSPNWILPRNDHEISSLRRASYRYLPFVRTRHRAQLMDVREAQYEALFKVEGSVHQFVKTSTAKQIALAFPGEENAAVRDMLTPRYPPGCKRILISDDYYPALARDNVILETGPLQQVSAHSITVGSGLNSEDGYHDAKDYELDIIVTATGFDATGFLAGLDIRNGEDVSIHEYWSQGIITNLGIIVPKFPNFGMLFGPNTNLGHNSIILMIEAQSLFINKLIKELLQRADGGGYETLAVEPREDVSRAWMAKVQVKLQQSTLASSLCSSWYKNEAGQIPTNWSEPVVTYQKETSRVEWSDFLLTRANGVKERGSGRTSWARVIEETKSTEFLSFGVVAVGLLASAWFYYTRKHL